MLSGCRTISSASAPRSSAATPSIWGLLASPTGPNPSRSPTPSGPASPATTPSTGSATSTPRISSPGEQLSDLVPGERLDVLGYGSVVAGGSLGETVTAGLRVSGTCRTATGGGAMTTTLDVQAGLGGQLGAA